jgi:hypothetical protein
MKAGRDRTQMERMMSDRSGPIVTVSIDTEEDDWGRYDQTRPSTNNIRHLPELQDLFDRWGARATYFVNRPPLVDAASSAVLAALAERDDLEIGGHCHPWNTPPIEDGAPSMMSALTYEQNLAKVGEITERIRTGLGVRPTSFRCGRWALGPTVSQALHECGYVVDSSVTPLLDWTAVGGPDFTRAPRRPYRFAPHDPLEPAPHGSMVEVPATVGFIRGRQDRMAAIRRRLAAGPLRRLRVLGLLDRIGIVRRRRLSPEGATGDEMVRLTAALARAGEPIIGITFHSCTLLPGATPYVRSEAERTAFLGRLDTVLRHCHEQGYPFMTVREAAAAVT